jgi:hypothetical protein
MTHEDVTATRDFVRSHTIHRFRRDKLALGQSHIRLSPDRRDQVLGHLRVTQAEPTCCSAGPCDIPKPKTHTQPAQAPTSYSSPSPSQPQSGSHGSNDLFPHHTLCRRTRPAVAYDEQRFGQHARDIHECSARSSYRLCRRSREEAGLGLLSSDILKPSAEL